MDATANHKAMWEFGRGTMWSSIVVQQIVFLFVVTYRISGFGVAIWVVWAPAVILWALWFVAPAAYVKPRSVATFLRAYSMQGWLFAFAAACWFEAYQMLSSTNGPPIDKILQVLHKP